MYQEFISLGMALGDMVCLMTKDSWMKLDSLSGIREKMLSFGIREFVDYPVKGDVFSGIGVSVGYALLQRGYGGDALVRTVKRREEASRFSYDPRGYGVFLMDPYERAVYDKMEARTGACGSFGKHVQPYACFGIVTNGNTAAGVLDMRQDRSGEYDLPVAFRGSSGAYFMYTKKPLVKRGTHLIGPHKVVCGYQINDSGGIVTNIHGIPGGSATSGQYSVLYANDNLEEASNALKYVKTKFLRYLVKCLCGGRMSTVSEYYFRLVPDQNFTSGSDIDWAKPVPEIDRQLYKKYGLSDDESRHIEETIKPAG